MELLATWQVRYWPRPARKSFIPVTKFAPIRLLLFIALILPLFLPERAEASAAFLSGTTANSPYPYYQQYFSSVPVGKTLVVPVAITGTSVPMNYSVTSSNPNILAVLKTGCPVMNIHVTYSGTTGSSSTVYSFKGGDDGGNPYAGVVAGFDGNLYGTTETDGSDSYGAIYQLTLTGSLVTLHAFTGGTDGASPYAPLLSYDGNLYGVAEAGGTNGFGTVFAITTSGSFSTLYSFNGAPDGANPYGGLASASVQQLNGDDGSTIPLTVLMGTAKNGGASGDGSIYILGTTGSGYQTLYSFTGGMDGANPAAGVIKGSDDNYYGTTVAGGSYSAGTVYQLVVTSTAVETSGTYAVITSGSLNPLHSFTGGADGGGPYGGLVQASDGSLYGTTETGGTGAGNYGTIYRITTSGSLTTLYTFSGGSDGGNPYAPLVEGTDGFLYGVAETGGSNGYGSVFRVSTSGSFTTVLALSPGSTGANPYGGLYDDRGDLYGTASTSGSGGHGTVYQVPQPNAGAFQGTMRFALLRDMAPTTVGYIAGLAQAGYYNGTDFFRITNLSGAPEDSFIAQGGDPTETGSGSLGFSFNNEFNPALIFTGYGQLAMANAGANQDPFVGSNGSQFFFTGGQIRFDDFANTIFGQLLTGFDVMQNVLSVPLQSDGSSPVQKVVMDSVTVSPNNTDAVLLVSAAGYVPTATLKINATSFTDGSKATSLSGTGLAIGISTPATDTVNDPPIILPQADVTAPLHQSATFPIRAEDLEFDYLINSAVQLTYGVTVSQRGNSVIVSPTAGSPVTPAIVGLETYEPYSSADPSTPYGQTPVNIYLGTGNMTPTPATFLGEPGSPVVASTAALGGTATLFGSFLSANPNASASAFSATINWGDGTLSTGTAGGVTVVHTGPIPTQYSVSGSGGHIYSQPGIYPLSVTVSETNGGMMEFQNAAVVSSGPIYAYGRTFTAAGGLADALVATFVDGTPGLNATKYEADINWGDGTVAKGVVTGARGSYSVYGRHQYLFGTTYPVDVTVKSGNNLAEAWSVASLSGVASRQPPFAQSHIIGQIGSPGFNGLYVSEEVVLLNCGNVASGPIALKFYLSPSSSVSPISPAAIPLSVSGFSTYNTPPIPAGQSIAGAVSKITLPSNVSSAGKYIIMQVITSDAVGSHMLYPRAFADSFPLIE